MAISDSPWKIVYMHHPPYSSGLHGSIDWMQWSFAEWGVDVVISGHDHTYERISRDGILYFVNGLGGRSKYPFFGTVEGSQVRYNEDHGAMLVEASESNVRFQFINRQGVLIDAIELAQLTSFLYLPVIHLMP
jgi:predicted phosphodiesterase